MNPLRTRLYWGDSIGVSRGLQLFVLLLVLFGAIAVRWAFFEESHIVSERQYRSALIARAYTIRASEDEATWRRHAAEASLDRAGLMEPPITEMLTSWTQRVFGGDHLLVGKIYSAIFWLIGGVLLYTLAQMIASPGASLVAVSYYLFVPMGVQASLAFLPDTLMTMSLIAALILMVSYFEQPNTRKLIAASIVSGVAILIKPFCMFVVLGAFVSLTISEGVREKRVRSAETLFFLLISLGIGAPLYAYGVLISGSLSSNFQAGFLPYLLWQRQFWQDWLVIAVGSVGLIPLCLAIVGFPLLGKGIPRALIVGMSLGFLAFGMTYNFPIRLAGYYYLQLIVIVALALAPLVALMVRTVLDASERRLGQFCIGVATTLLLLFTIRDLGQELDATNTPESAEVAGEIGDLVGHSTRTVYVSTFYGKPLEYYGQLSGVFWPNRIADMDWVRARLGGQFDEPAGGLFDRFAGWLTRRVDARELSVEERIASLGFTPEYFIISDLKRYRRVHQDLDRYLRSSCELVSNDARYLVFSDCD